MRDAFHAIQTLEKRVKELESDLVKARGAKPGIQDPIRKALATRRAPRNLLARDRSQQTDHHYPAEGIAKRRDALAAEDAQKADRIEKLRSRT